MNRNQKIAIGCGAAGCLGLVLVVLVCAVAYFALRSSSTNANRSRSFNLNDNSTVESNTANNDSESANTSEETTLSTLSEDEKHKLFQAAHVTQDMSLIQRVWTRLELTNADGAPNEQYTQFLKDHVTWLFSNSEFVQEINTPEKARAYVEAHLND